MRASKTFAVGRDPVVDLADAEQVQAADEADVALALCRAAFAADPQAEVARRELVAMHARGDAGLARVLAQAFAALGRAGAVCETATGPTDAWFLTNVGRWVLGASAPRDELLRLLGRL